MEKEFEFRRKRETIEDWTNEIYEECTVIYGENSDRFDEEYEKRCNALIKEYEAALSQAIKNGERIGDEHIAAIREYEMCGWSWGSDKVCYYDLEKSYEAKIMIVQIDGEVYGIHGYETPYDAFEAGENVFRKMKKVEKVVTEYIFEEEEYNG